MSHANVFKNVDTNEMKLGICNYCIGLTLLKKIIAVQLSGPGKVIGPVYVRLSACVQLLKQ